MMNKPTKYTAFVAMTLAVLPMLFGAGNAEASTPEKSCVLDEAGNIPPDCNLYIDHTKIGASDPSSDTSSKDEEDGESSNIDNDNILNKIFPPSSKIDDGPMQRL